MVVCIVKTDAHDCLQLGPLSLNGRHLESKGGATSDHCKLCLDGYLQLEAVFFFFSENQNAFHENV